MPERATTWSKRDRNVLAGVYLNPWCTADQVARLRRLGAVPGVRTSLARLVAHGLVTVVSWRGVYALARVKLYQVSAAGVDVLSDWRGWSEEEAYGRMRMSSRQWQRHLLKHVDLVQVAYGLGARLSDIRDEDEGALTYFPRHGSFDALVWRDLQEGLSVGIIRKGPMLSEQQLFARLSRISRGDDQLNHHQGFGGRRGPGTILILVQHEFEKQRIARLFQMFGKLRGKGLVTLIATEEEAARGVYTSCRDPRALVDAGSIATFVPPKSSYTPQARSDYVFHKPLPAERLPSVLAPVQRRVLECLHRWPLMRPTEIAQTIRTGYAGWFKDYLRELVRLDLVKSVRDLERADMTDYEPADVDLVRRTMNALDDEYRNIPLLLSDDGLRFLCARDRAGTKDVLATWGTEQVDEETGKVKLGGSIRKLIRELRHTLGVNSLVARVCTETDYLPEVLPDHLSTYYFKGSTWTRNEYLQTTSVAPDVAVLLKQGEEERTILLEYERQATRGGKALTRKLEVWMEYWNHVRTNHNGYLGLELVAFVVPTERSKALLKARWREMLRRQYMLRRHLPLLVATEKDLSGSVMNDEVWEVASHPPDGPKLALNFKSEDAD